MESLPVAPPPWCRQPRSRRRTAAPALRRGSSSGLEESSTSTTASNGQNCNTLSGKPEVLNESSLFQCRRPWKESVWLDQLEDVSQSEEAQEITIHPSPGIFSNFIHDEVKKSSPSKRIHGKRCNMSSSQVMKDDYSEEGRRRGKRKRKPKVPFDEKCAPEKPTRRVRCLKIMRQLGLIAPVGSPFSRTRQ